LIAGVCERKRLGRRWSHYNAAKTIWRGSWG